VLAQRMQIVQVAHRRWIRIVQTGELGAGAARQADEFIRRRLDCL
jgi:hypothetical protein